MPNIEMDMDFPKASRSKERPKGKRRKMEQQ